MQILISLFDLKNEILNKKITLYAAQASFFLLLSLIPFLIALMNVIQFFTPDMMDAIYRTLERIPYKDTSRLLNDLVSQLALYSNGALISFTLVSALWSSSKSVYAIEYALNNIYESQHTFGFILSRLVSFFYMIFFIFILLITMVVLMFGHSIQKLFKLRAPGIYQITHIILQFRLLAIVPMLIFFFMCLYTFYPGRNLKFKEQFWGAVFSASAWVIFSRGYEYYIQHITSYSRIYGSMGAVVLLMLWLYFCICIVLLGAELNSYLKKVGCRTNFN